METKSFSYILFVFLILRSFDGMNCLTYHEISCLDSEDTRLELIEMIAVNNVSSQLVQSLEDYYRNEPKPYREPHFILTDEDQDQCQDNTEFIPLPLILFLLLYLLHLIIFYNYLTQNFAKY